MSDSESAQDLTSESPRRLDEKARRDPDDFTVNQARIYLSLILLVGLVLRLALWLNFDQKPPQIWDERDYDTLAMTLAEYGEFAFEPGYPISLRPPLYPALVAGVYEVAGMQNYQAVRLVQIPLSLLIVSLAYVLGAQIESRRVGVWAAGFCSVYPSLVAYHNLLLTEILFTALLMAFIVSLIRAQQRDSIARLVPAGVLLGLGALARSVLWPTPVIFGVYLLLAWRGHLGRRLLAGVVLAAATWGTIAPWAIRNTKLQETFTTVDVMSGRNLMMGNYEHTPMYRAWDAISVEGERSWIYVLSQRYPDEMGGLTQGQIDKLALKAAVAFVRENPVLTLKRDIVKFFHFWGLERELVAGAASGYFGEISTPGLLALTALIFGSYVAAMIAGIFGAVVRPPSDWRGHVLLLLVISYLCAMHTLSFGHSRYHLPLIPLILVYAGNAVVYAREIWSRRRTWAFGVALALIALFVAGWAWEVLIVDLQRFTAMIRPNA
ncbi:ArnT family glycosyltransferase [Tautonia rosea]|uniref:ArnT family glycosyltransferase n=1 Tax=Tautonia rosea TaxID=2728037 RepID=UPI0014737EC5|nr:glycosyltransferase family 39 protein [Tautonia rosea]